MFLARGIVVIVLRAVKAKVLIVVGKAKARAILALHPPGAANGSDTGPQMVQQILTRTHSRTSTTGTFSIFCAALV